MAQRNPVEEKKTDLESDTSNENLRHWHLLWDQGILTRRIIKHDYAGSGTEDDPYVVIWIDNDPRNPTLFPYWYKWVCTSAMALSVLAVSFCSSAYTGGIPSLMADFHASEEVVLLGLSVFVLGFAVGPLFWAPLSEQYGRQILFVATFGVFAIFNAGLCGSKNITTVIVLRFIAGSFGSSPFTNAGGVVADLFSAKERSLAMAIFSAPPFLGPVLGPVVGGFLGQAAHWRWVFVFMTIFSAFVWILGTVLTPETYPPVLLRRRADKLTKLTGKVYRTRQDIDQGKLSLAEIYKTALSRPWILLIREPIVLLLSIYMAIIYGTLYLLFSAYPIVYQQGRGWSQGLAGLPFLGVMIGMMLSILYTIAIDEKRYRKAVDKNGGVFAPPEARLPPCQIAAVVLPVGLVWFAWTNYPTFPWAASVAAGIPFGFGMVLIFLGIMNYLIDAYTIFAASVLAANGVIRCLFSAVFPLFTTQMYARLGIHWATMVPAVLALVCLPFPFIFFKFGASIRAKCKYAAEADVFMKKLRGELPRDPTGEGEGDAIDRSSDKDGSQLPRFEFERIRTANQSYEDSPFDLDRMNTRDSFGGGMKKSKSRETFSGGVRKTKSRESVMRKMLEARK